MLGGPCALGMWGYRAAVPGKAVALLEASWLVLLLRYVRLEIRSASLNLPPLVFLRSREPRWLQVSEAEPRSRSCSARCGCLAKGVADLLGMMDHFI